MKFLLPFLTLLSLTVVSAQAQCKDCGCKEKCSPKCTCKHDETPKPQ